MHGLTALSVIALAAASIRCAILAIFTVENFVNPITPHNSNTTHVFDLIHSFIQSIHVVEYFALLYGVGGFYLFAVVRRDKCRYLNDIYKETSRSLVCTCSCSCVGFMLACFIGTTILIISAFVPLGLLTAWKADIITASRIQFLTTIYVGTSYFSHVCHSVTRMFMVYITVLVRSAWLDQQQPQLRVQGQENRLAALAKMIYKPKWMEYEVANGYEEQRNSRTEFASLVKNYNTTGQFVSALHIIFQQWFVMQWLVYFIKIIEDFSIALDSLVTEKYADTDSERNKLLFVLTHLVFDLLLFLIPYFCASLFNQYHDEYRERIQKLQSDIFSEDDQGWMFQCAELIPERSKYIFIPSICGVSIPLNSPGYNLSIIFALFAFIISIMTAL
jgi:hypothetical protein